VFLLVDIVLFLISLGLLVPITVLFVECSAALLLSKSASEPVPELHPTVTVLVPAHNEALGISATLEILVPQLSNPEQVVVIADNCSDETAALARTFGVRVIERQDNEQRGKGYALDYGLQSLKLEPPDVVVVVDADCIVHQGTIEQIAQLAAAMKRPVQATYLMEQPPNPGPKDAVSALAFMVKNLVRPYGLKRLGLPSLLTGTGMAFPWSALQNTTLASGNIVEDMQLGLDLAIVGQPPIFCEEGKVTGRLPQQAQAATSQRTRWEHGHLQTLLTQVPKLLQLSISQRRFDLFALALDMCVPPLSLLVMIWLIVLVGALVAGAFGTSWLPAIFLFLEGLLIVVSIIGAWAKFGREDLPARTLLSIPFYVLWKIPLYFSFLVRPQTKWIRTERDSIETPES